MNSLEDKTNPYRAVFAVDKLNEGWDVLNLFDIVRLYETRDGKNSIPGKTTMKEAQLIGRGARYCPFQVSNEQEKYKRKYDSDIDNPLRICETLYYHCWNEPRYISELYTALREIGLDLEKTVTREYVLKDDFKSDLLYKQGYVFINDRVLHSRTEITELLPSVKSDIGFSQNDNTVFKDWKLDLSKEDWYVFDDNYGTSEEKAFVAYFKQYADELKGKYDKVYLIRNERQLHIYSFAGGERFEPDYLLFLQSDKSDGYEQIQVFIEPKGTGLIPKDQWKEDFMLEMKAKAVPVVTFADDNRYKIWGFHFFNHEVRNAVFADDMKKL